MAIRIKRTMLDKNPRNKRAKMTSKRAHKLAGIKRVLPSKQFRRIVRNPKRPRIRHLWTLEAAKNGLYWHFTNAQSFADTGGNRMLFHSAAEAQRRMKEIVRLYKNKLIANGFGSIRVSRFQ